MPKHIFGGHLSLQKKLVNIALRADELKFDSFQFFGGNPRQWKSAPFDEKEIILFKNKIEQTGIKKFFLHSIYLVNLASKNKFIYQSTIDSLIDFMMKADKIGAEGVITHIGSTRGHVDGHQARTRIALAINKIITSTKKKALILENTAWGEGELGSSVEGLKQIYQLIKNKKRIGFCIDTAHLFESGYDIRTKKGLDDFVKKFDKEIGLDKIRVIHINDSKTALGSKSDRHEVIGKGELGLEAIGRIINHPKFIALPMLLETPDLHHAEGKPIPSLKAIRKLAK